MSRSKGKKGQGCKEIERWIPAVVEQSFTWTQIQMLLCNASGMGVKQNQNKMGVCHIASHIYQQT